MQKFSIFLVLVLAVAACGSTSSQENDLNSALGKIKELENQILELEEEALSTVTTSEATTTTTTTTTTTLSPSSTTTTTRPSLYPSQHEFLTDLGCTAVPLSKIFLDEQPFLYQKHFWLQSGSFIMKGQAVMYQSCGRQHKRVTKSIPELSRGPACTSAMMVLYWHLLC